MIAEAVSRASRSPPAAVQAIADQALADQALAERPVSGVMLQAKADAVPAPQDAAACSRCSFS